MMQADESAEWASFVLDRASPVPLWFQVAEQLEATIGGGQLPPGSRMPNEVDLADRLDVSRPTMRRAMQYLVDKGLVVRQRGAGTRVVSTQVRRSLELTSLYDDLVASGQHPQTRVLSNEIEPAASEVAAALRLQPGDPVVTVVRLRSAADQPIARLTNYLPAERFAPSTADLERSGLYALMRRANIQLHSASQVIGARVAASAAEARLFGQRRGAALLTMQRTAFDDHGVPVEYGDHIYDAQRYTFQLVLRSP